MNDDGPPLHIIRIFFMIRIGMSESFFFILACSSKYPGVVDFLAQRPCISYSIYCSPLWKNNGVGSTVYVPMITTLPCKLRSDFCSCVGPSAFISERYFVRWQSNVIHV